MFSAGSILPTETLLCLLEPRAAPMMTGVSNYNITNGIL